MFPVHSSIKHMVGAHSTPTMNVYSIHTGREMVMLAVILVSVTASWNNIEEREESVHKYEKLAECGSPIFIP